tara:strand:+ start:155923 stop:156429 length:507 start_codon:yes stop_codon:yes gene_type:complete
MPRQSNYTPEIAREICERLAAGESLRSICREDRMPDDSTVRSWVLSNSHENFTERYLLARDSGMDTIADELLEISDDGRNDWMVSNDPDNPGYKLNGESVQRSKLRVDTRKWYLSKIAPKRYGDSARLALTGPDGERLDITDTQRVEKILALLAVAQRRKADDANDLV